MSHADDFIRALQKDVAAGNATKATELHLKREFQRRGWGGAPEVLAHAVTEEIRRLERELGTLKKLRAALFGVE